MMILSWRLAPRGYRCRNHKTEPIYMYMWYTGKMQRREIIEIYT